MPTSPSGAASTGLVPRPVDADRLGDVFDFPFAQVIESRIELARDLVVNTPRDIYHAGLAQFLQSGRRVHTTTENIVSLDYHVAEVDSDAQDDPPVLRLLGIVLREPALNLDRALDRIDGTAEFGKGTVTGILEDPPTELFGLGVE